MMKAKTIIVKSVKKFKKQYEKEKTARIWLTWLGARFAETTSWYNSAKEFPERYKEGADKTFAKMAMNYFKEICDYDKDAARTLFDSWRTRIYEMAETMEVDVHKYYKMMQ